MLEDYGLGTIWSCADAQLRRTGTDALSNTVAPGPIRQWLQFCATGNIRGRRQGDLVWDGREPWSPCRTASRWPGSRPWCSDNSVPEAAEWLPTRPPVWTYRPCSAWA